MFFGKNMSRSRATGGLVEALRNHELEVKWINIATLRRWIGRDLAIRSVRRAFERFDPDIVFVFCRDLPFPLLKEFSASATTVVWVEEPLEKIAEDYVDYLAEANAVFITNPSKLQWLRSRGIHHAAFVLEGFSSTYHYPVEGADYRRDVVFIGGPGREGKRAAFLSRIAEKHDLEICGCHWGEWATLYPNLRIRGPVRPPGFRQLCATSRIVLGLNQVNGDSLYFSNRTFLTLACRGFHLTHYVPGLERVFKDREHLAWYTDLEDCLEKVDYYLANESERKRVAEAGCEYVRSAHRFDSRIQYILHTLRAGVVEQPAWLPFDRAEGVTPIVPAATASE
jgi:hypothetical protein